MYKSRYIFFSKKNATPKSHTEKTWKFNGNAISYRPKASSLANLEVLYCTWLHKRSRFVWYSLPFTVCRMFKKMKLSLFILLVGCCFVNIAQPAIIKSWQNISNYLDQLIIKPYESHLKKILNSNKTKDEISENCLSSIERAAKDFWQL